MSAADAARLVMLAGHVLGEALSVHMMLGAVVVTAGTVLVLRG